MKKFILMLVAALATTSLFGAVTFKVQVPDGSKRCYVCGDFNSWDVTTAPELTLTGENLFTITLDDVTPEQVSKGYKYLSGRDWLYVEKDAQGQEIDNRTTPGDPDVVGSWRSLPDWGVESVDLIINGIPRQIRVYLPEGYEETTETYPVIYYNTVQQRYSNAGSDDDNGDNFFSKYSWNAQATMEAQRNETGKAYIMVQICSMLAENTPEVNPDYLGTGEAHKYLEAFTQDLMPYIEGRWRVKTGKENTTILGADYGALFSLYAALERPDLFGNSVVMSPMLWINEGAFSYLIPSASEGQNFYISAGSKEPEWLINPTRALSDELKAQDSANVYYTLYDGMAHNDDDWGKSFPILLSALASASSPNVGDDLPEDEGSDFEDHVYTLYGGTSASDLKKVAVLEYTRDFRKQKTDTPLEAFVITNDLGTEYKSKYYWNVKKGDEDGNDWLYSETKNVGFSDSKKVTSWHNVAVLADGTVENVAANSEAFNVYTTTSTPMTIKEGHIVEATVSFPDSHKSFEIRYGSVNSGSNMGALTPTFTVGDNCTEAVITYDFNINKVTVEETATGDAQEPETGDFSSQVFTLYGGENGNDMQLLGKLSYTTDYRPMGTETPVEAFVFTAEIPVSFKSVYYWNIAKGESKDSGWLLGANKNVSFKDSKSEASWLNVAVLSDGTTKDVAAHSKAFLVKSSTGNVTMVHSGDHTSNATVSFPTDDKSFEVRYGSVNSGSDMGAITPGMNVSENCLEAEITYDFNLNKVTVVETKTGEVVEGAKIKRFSAVPAVGIAGSDVNLSLELNKACDVTISCKNSAGTNIPVTLKQTGIVTYTAELPQLSEGLYTISVNVSDGNSPAVNSSINVRMVAGDPEMEKELTINVYEGIDWKNIGRYKSNFHTHTSQSFDTSYTTTEVVDKYQAAGYKVLALTDHDANSYPWNMFSLYNPQAQDREADEMGMLSIPGNELSKDRRNNWSETTGGEFNHHNDFFTGRKGQEFMSLRESYAYTQAIGGLQIINHPGQYWNLSTEYKAGEKNSPEWHAENFKLYDSLIGLEVYNQGNRRPNDRILWDQVLTITMPERPVWGYSCDDTHTAEQYFRNYQYMLMPELSVDALKDAMKAGSTVFSYEYTGSGKALAPSVNEIEVDHENQTITIDSDDADTVEWIYSTHRTGSSASTTQSTIIGYGPTFDFSNYQGSYVRARLVNKYGETAIQPFGFTVKTTSAVDKPSVEKSEYLRVINNPGSESVTLVCSEPMLRVSVVNAAGSVVKFMEFDKLSTITFDKSELSSGVYVVVVATEKAAYTGKFMR